MGTYSTGMKQRVKLAQALVHDPVLAFLDEPTAGLDPLGRREMLELIRRVGREFGISIVISTHLMGDVERVCDSVVVLDRGQLLRTGAVSGFTEETETRRARARRGRRRARRGARAARARRAARRQPADARATSPATTTTRCATRSSRRARCSTASRRRGTRSPTSSRPAEAEARERSRRGRGLRPRLPRLRGRAHGPMVAAARDLAGRRADLARPRARARREVHALAAARARARPDRRARRDLGVPRRRLEEAEDDFELPSYADYYDWAVVPLGLFAAIVAPLLLCPDRRDGVLSLYAARPITPADYVGARWAAFLAVMLRSPAWLPAAILFAWNALDASSPGSWLVDNWDVVPRFLAAGATVALVLTTLALFASVVRDAARVRGRRRSSPRFFVGSAIGGIAEENFSGPVSDALSLASIPAGARRQRALDLRRPDGDRAPARRLGLAALARRSDGGARLRARAADRAAGARMSAQSRRSSSTASRSGSAGVVAVSDVSLVVEPGVTALLGPNGAGKTTLLRAIAGLTAPSQGQRDRLRRARPRQPTAVPPDRLHARARVGLRDAHRPAVRRAERAPAGRRRPRRGRAARGRDGRSRRRAGPPARRRTRAGCASGCASPRSSCTTRRC